MTRLLNLDLRNPTWVARLLIPHGCYYMYKASETRLLIPDTNFETAGTLLPNPDTRYELGHAFLKLASSTVDLKCSPYFSNR